MGYLFATLSVILVTLAQILLKWAMIYLPAINNISFFSKALFSFSYPSLALFLGLFFYLLSTITWIFALKWLPLGRAYSLLSLSYILVWGIALYIPEFNESFSFINLGGILIIFTGLLLIFLPGIHKTK